MSDLFSSFFNVAESKKPAKSIEQSYAEANSKTYAYKKQCSRKIVMTNIELEKAKENLKKYAKEDNKKLGAIMFKKVSKLEAIIKDTQVNIEVADLIMMELDTAKSAKLMADLQSTAATVYKQINKQISVEKIREVSRNLETQRDTFKEKNESIDELNNTLINDMLISPDDDDADDSNNKDYDDYVEMMLRQEELEAQTKIALAVSSSSSKTAAGSSLTEIKEKKTDYLDEVLNGLNLESAVTKIQ